MRRLTNFEKEIVKKIHSLETTEFDYLVNPYMKEDFYFAIVSNYSILMDRGIGFDDAEIEYGVIVYTKAFPDSKEDRKKIRTQMLLRFNLINNIERLARLLEHNGLINIYEGEPNYKSKHPKFLGRHYNLNTEEEDYEKGIIKVQVTHSKASTERLMKITNSIIYPTPALEIYVKTGFRTEEQKNNDFNRVIGRLTLGAAVLGLCLSGYYSFKTYNYTLKKDIEDSVREGRKDSLTNLFRDKVMLNVESLGKKVELKKKEEPVQSEK